MKFLATEYIPDWLTDEERQALIADIKNKTDWYVLKHVAAHSPVEYAGKIIHRNAVALRAANRDRDDTYDDIAHIELGCPHCNADYDCTNCQWANVPFDKNHVFFKKRFPCCHVSFGGIDLHELTHVEMEECVTLCHDSIEVVRFDCLQDFSLAYKMLRFLVGHIEWGVHTELWGTAL